MNVTTSGAAVNKRMQTWITHTGLKKEVDSQSAGM